jgi:DNA repair ATPase RecN
MALKDIATDLESWAAGGKPSDPQVAFVKALVQDLGTKAKLPGLARVDLLSTASALMPREPRRVAGATSALFLAPVAVTWLHLFFAVQDFRSNINRGRGQNFLTFWSGGYDWSPPVWQQLQSVAIQVLAIVLLLAFLNWFLSTEHMVFIDRRQADLKALLAKCQVELAHAGSLSPQDVTDALSMSVLALETAIVKAADTLQAIEGSTKTIELANQQLADSSGRLAEATMNLDKASSALTDFPARLEVASSALGGVASHLAELRARAEAFNKDLLSIQQVHQNSVSMGSEAATISAKNARDVESLVNHMKSFSASLEKISAQVAGATQQNEVLAASIIKSEPELYVLVDAVRKLASSFEESIDRLQRIGESFADSAEVYRSASLGDGNPPGLS